MNHGCKRNGVSSVDGAARSPAAWNVAAAVRLRPHPQGWTAAAVLELANVVGTHAEAVLVADDEFGAADNPPDPASGSHGLRNVPGRDG